MGYIEDIKKINALAKELLQHNIVSSQDEAVVKAREMLVKKPGNATVQNEEYVDLSRPQERAQAAQAAESRAEDWKEAMAKNNEYIVSEMRGFKNSVELLMTELQTLRSEVNTLRRQNMSASTQQPAQQMTQPAPQPQQQQHAQVVHPQQAQAESKPQPHPRAGNYTPADVSVEKFFYFGTKK